MSLIDRLGLAISNAGVVWTNEMRELWDELKGEEVERRKKERDRKELLDRILGKPGNRRLVLKELVKTWKAGHTISMESAIAEIKDIYNEIEVGINDVESIAEELEGLRNV